MKSWKLGLREGPHVPWERDELWAPFISTRSPWRRRRGARREMGLSLSRAWPGTGIPCERCLRPGHQGPKNPGPSPAPHTRGTSPRTSLFRPHNPGSQALRPIRPLAWRSQAISGSRRAQGHRQGRGWVPERPLGRIHSQGCSHPVCPGRGWGLPGPWDLPWKNQACLRQTSTMRSPQTQA